MTRSQLAVALVLALAGSAAYAAEPIDAQRAASANAHVEVHNIRGRVDVRGADVAQVRVKGTVGEGSKFSFTGEGDHLVIRIENEEENWSWWGGSGPKEDSMLTVEVPRAASIEVNTVSADVDVDGIVGARELEVESVSGDQRVRGDAERVEVSSVSGDVTLDGQSRVVSLETVSGDIDARRVAGRVTAETVSGRIKLETGAVDDLTVGTVSGDVELRAGGIGSGRVKIESMSGEVDFFVPANLSARIEAESFSGSIQSDFGEVEEEEHGPGSHLSTTVGNGAAQITLESFSGDVTIRQQ